MATINLGAIKFNWKGAYNSSTSYAVDDVVSSSGNSYVCIQAHSTAQAVGNATAYWNIMSSAGTNGTDGSDGTDVGTTLTTQGDLLYRDGSGLQRLAKGTAGKVLKMNSGASAPEWGTDVGGKILQVVNHHVTGQYSSNSTSWTYFGGLQTFGITPTLASSKILILSNWHLSTSNWNMFKYMRSIGGGSWGDFLLPTGASGSRSNGHFSGAKFADGDAELFKNISCNLYDSPNTTSEVRYQLNNRSWNPNVVYLNQTQSNGNYHTTGNVISSVTLIEIGA